MSTLVHARVVEHLQRLRLGFVAERLDAVLNEAAKREPTYLDFLDQVLRQEVEAKQRKRVAMGVQIAHFPTVKTLEEFEFKFQPSIDQRLVRELATGRFISSAENILIFGPPGVGKTHLAIALGRAGNGRRAACSSRTKRSHGRSCVVPCTRRSASSIHWARCCSSAANDAKVRPARALRFTNLTPDSTLPLVRARYGAQARGWTSQSRQKAR